MRISQLSPQWLAAALEVDPARITGLETAPVGTGQMADTYRLSFHLDGAAQSLILKLTSDAPASRETARRQLNYVREVRYYQALAATVEVRAPRCQHAFEFGLDAAVRYPSGFQWGCNELPVVIKAHE